MVSCVPTLVKVAAVVVARPVILDRSAADGAI